MKTTINLLLSLALIINLSSCYQIEEEPDINIDELIRFSAGNSYDFGDVTLNTSSEGILTIVNSSDNRIEDIKLSQGISSPFAFKGGNFPGTSGTCKSEGSIDSKDQCTMVVLFSPTSLEKSSDKIVIQYTFEGEEKTLSLDITGTGVNTTASCNPSTSDFNGFGGGTGTVSDPYLICTNSHLQLVRNHMSKHFKMTKDLDVGSTLIKPFAGAFTGSFDGNLHTISNYSGETALFYAIGLGGTLKNLGMIKSEISGFGIVGGLATLVSGTISKCYFSGKVISIALDSYGTKIQGTAGGLVGQLSGGSIEKSYSLGTVNSEGHAGGLVGTAMPTCNINNSYSWANVTNTYATTTSSTYVRGFMGGLIVNPSSTTGMCKIVNSYSKGVVVGHTYALKNGFIGFPTLTVTKIENSYWDKEASNYSLEPQFNGTGLTSAQIKNPDNLVTWDFINIWKIDEASKYPVLR